MSQVPKFNLFFFMQVMVQKIRHKTKALFSAEKEGNVGF